VLFYLILYRLNLNNGGIIQSQEAHEQFKRFLKRGKHRITPERFEVLDYALEQPGHFGADELFISMKTQNSNVSRATVYNTLELLAKCKLLAKRNFGDNKAHYESSFKRKNHDHLICTHCGKILEFTSDEIQNIVDLICEEQGMERTGYSFNIFARCKDPNKCKNF